LTQKTNITAVTVKVIKKNITAVTVKVTKKHEKRGRVKEKDSGNLLLTDLFFRFSI